jgi:hypothetical protein
MSLAAERQEQEYSQGWRFVDGPQACGECAAGLEPVEQFVRETGTSDTCSYCGASGVLVVTVNDLLEFLFEGLRTEYGQADAESMPIVEGRYMLETQDGTDLLFWSGFSVDNEKLQANIDEATRGFDWCQLDPLAPAPHEQSLYSWQRFSRILEHEVRYLFSDHAPAADWMIDADAPVPPAEILTHVENVIRDVPGLIRTLPAGARFHRARWGSNPAGYQRGRVLGPPPPSRALAPNRMTPPGISVFYGAVDELTALVETVPRGRRGLAVRPYATVAAWVQTGPAVFIDLTADPPMPSIFDPARRHLRSGIQFLRHFRAEISRPTTGSDTGAYEYVPTQVLTEYIRLAFEVPDGQRPAGILYPSARGGLGANAVVFAGPDDCEFPPARRDGALLRLDRRSIGAGISAATVRRRHAKAARQAGGSRRIRRS